MRNNTRLPSLPALRAFEVVARHSSMKKAAQELFVTPGAISQLIKRLESDLDAELLKRTNRELTLTPKGQQLNGSLHALFSDLDMAIDRFNKTERHIVNLACSTDSIFTWLVNELPHMYRDIPNIEINLTSRHSNKNIENNQCDIFIELSKRNQNCSVFDIVGEEYCSMMATPQLVKKDRLDSLESMYNSRLILESETDALCGYSIFEHYLQAAEGACKPSFKSIHCGMHSQQALQAALTGVGIVLGHHLTALTHIEANRLVVPFGPSIPTGLYYCVGTQNRRPNSRHVSVFREWLTERLGASIARSKNITSN